MAGNEVRLVLADDHPVVLKGLVHLLETLRGVRVAAACGTGSEALSAIREHRPAIAILDIGMPDMTGLDVARAVAQLGLPTRIILLTASASDRQREEARLAGAPLLFKDAAPDELLDLVAATLGRQPPKGEGGRESSLEVAQAVGALVGLTAREREIARLVSEGMSNRDLSRTLSLSEATVKAHLHNIFAKTGLTSRTALASLTLRRGNSE